MLYSFLRDTRWLHAVVFFLILNYKFQFVLIYSNALLVPTSRTHVESLNFVQSDMFCRGGLVTNRISISIALGYSKTGEPNVFSNTKDMSCPSSFQIQLRTTGVIFYNRHSKQKLASPVCSKNLTPDPPQTTYDKNVVSF